MRFLVRLWCGACGQHRPVIVPATRCPYSPAHVHISEETPPVQSWWASHRAPHIDVLEER